MFDYDVVIIGGGPAGLAAGLYLSRAGRSTILLEKGNFGGQIKNVEWIENYPGFADGISGPQLASEMVTQATKYGVTLKKAEVIGIDLYKSARWVKCTDGEGYTTSIVLIAAGAHPKKLGIPGEDELSGKGVFTCALCDGGQFADKVVAVCGGGDSGITEALYMTRLASKVVLIEAMPALTASTVLQERASSNPKLDIRCGMKVEAILGDQRVEAVELTGTEAAARQTLEIDGILVHVGLEPNTDYLKDIVSLDELGRIKVDEKMETSTQYILSAGDIRSGSHNQIVTAVGDGATAALSAERLLREQA